MISLVKAAIILAKDLILHSLAVIIKAKAMITLANAYSLMILNVFWEESEVILKK
jgi:hypothetical protein